MSIRADVTKLSLIGRELNNQNPLPMGNDSLYLSDIDFDNSDFTDWVGDPELLFQSPFSASIVNSTANNPKIIILAFKRTIYTSQIGFGENNGGNFSNIKLTKLGSGGFTRGVFDDSNKNEQLTSKLANFGNEAFNSIKIEFHTANAVSISNITIQKSRLSFIGNKVINAIPITSDSVYLADLDQELCSSAGFDGGTIADLISYSGKVLINDSIDNPKSLLIDLIRPIQSNILGLSTSDGDFSNVKISGRFGQLASTTVVIYDGSSDSTKRQILIPDIAPVTFSTIIIEFFTADTVSVSSIGISKAPQTIARIQGQAADGTLKDFKSTNQGNFKVSIEEYETDTNPIRSDLEGGGKIAVGTTAVEVTFSGNTKKINIQSDPNNTGILYIGKSDVTNTGVNAFCFLKTGEGILLDYDNGENPLYVVSDTASQNFWKGALL